MFNNEFIISQFKLIVNGEKNEYKKKNFYSIYIKINRGKILWQKFPEQFIIDSVKVYN